MSQKLLSSALASALASTLAVALVLLAGLSVSQAETSAPVAPAAAAIATPATAAVAAREAGIRYGQAAGAAVVCENTHATQKAEELIKAFSGAELETFKLQADTVLAAWKKTMTCETSGGPNQCRLAHQISCGEAYKEIGPEGKVAPGLVEYRKP
jgi:hypothetical protein